MSIKQERVAEDIREILSNIFLFEVTDPALQGITVTEVILDPELEYANCYVNALGEESRQKEVMEGLRRANGFLRREVGKRIRLRRVPYLNFHWDITLSRAEAIEEAIDRLHLPLTPPKKKKPTQDEGGDDELE